MNQKEITKVLSELYKPVAQTLKKECNIEDFDKACEHAYRHLALKVSEHAREEITMEDIKDAWDKAMTDLGLA